MIVMRVVSVLCSIGTATVSCMHFGHAGNAVVWCPFTCVRFEYWTHTDPMHRVCMQYMVTSRMHTQYMFRLSNLVIYNIWAACKKNTLITWISLLCEFYYVCRIWGVKKTQNVCTTYLRLTYLPLASCLNVRYDLLTCLHNHFSSTGSQNVHNLAIFCGPPSPLQTACKDGCDKG